MKKQKRGDAEAGKGKKRQIVKTGDVVAIPLPDGKYAFGLKIGVKTAIYSITSDRPDKPPIGHRKFLFATGVYADILSDTSWPKVGKDSISQSAVEFVSLGYIRDARAGTYELYSDFFVGYIKPSNMEQCYGLEPVSAWDSHHIVDRIIASLKSERSEWLSDSPWIPFAIDLTNSDHMKRIPVAEVLQ